MHKKKEKKKKTKKKKTKKKKKKTKRSSSGIPRRKNSPTDVNSNDANDADDTNRQISFVRRALLARGAFAFILLTLSSYAYLLPFFYYRQILLYV